MSPLSHLGSQILDNGVGSYTLPQMGTFLFLDV